MSKVVYLNMKTSFGRETVDEFSPEPDQTRKEFNSYVRQMITEYHIAGMDVYKSSRCCKGWK